MSCSIVPIDECCRDEKYNKMTPKLSSKKTGSPILPARSMLSAWSHSLAVPGDLQRPAQVFEVRGFSLSLIKIPLLFLLPWVRQKVPLNPVKRKQKMSVKLPVKLCRANDCLLLDWAPGTSTREWKEKGAPALWSACGLATAWGSALEQIISLRLSFTLLRGNGTSRHGNTGQKRGRPTGVG